MSSKFKVGDLVQYYTESNKVRDGKVTALSTPLSHRPDKFWSLPEEERNKYQTMVTMDCDGEVIVQEQGSVQERDDEFQRAYRVACDAAQELIYAKCEEAAKALSEAVRISELHGIPFSSGVSFLGQSYIPSSMSEFFPEVDRDFMMEVADASSAYDEEGWEHSAVC